MRLLLCVLFLSCPTLAAADPDPKKIAEVVSEALRAWEVPGVAVVIVTPEKTLYLEGHGTRELGGEPVTPDTLFPLASCTKAFTSTLLAQLVDEGKLGWDDPVRKHLPDFRLSDPAADALVTVRDLLSHRTGLAGHDLLWYRAPWSQEESLQRTLKLPLEKPFRTAVQYQSTMYLAAGTIVSKASGKSWGDTVQARLLQPLGMTRSSVTTPPTLKEKDRASGYRMGSAGKLVKREWYEQLEPNAAGSINSCARDLAPWLRMHLNLGIAGEQQIVSAQNLRETQTPHTIIRKEGAAKSLNPESQQISYGLGWVVQDYRGHLQIQHAGLIDGFRAHLTLLPQDGYALAILANREGTRLNLALSNRLCDLLCQLEAKEWNKYYQNMLAAEDKAKKEYEDQLLQVQKNAVPTNVPLEQFAGHYQDDAYGTVTIQNEKGKLRWDWSSWKLPLDHLTADNFRLVADHPELNGLLIRFKTEQDKVVKMSAFGRVFDKKWREKDCKVDGYFFLKMF